MSWKVSMKLAPGNFELDLPPEYCHYRDEGCELSKSCLSCPLPTCVYELRGGRQRWLKSQRNRAMVTEFTTQGREVKELAQSFGISQRTVQRVIRNHRIKPYPLSRQEEQEGKDEG